MTVQREPQVVELRRQAGCRMDLRGQSEPLWACRCDGNFTRYQGSAHGCAQSERACVMQANVGGTAGNIPVPVLGTGFLFFRRFL